MEIKPALFEGYDIRRVYDEQTETWYFSVVDIIRALLQQPDFQAARKYWNKLKERLQKEGSESVTNCHRLKLEAAGKKGGGIAKRPAWIWKIRPAEASSPERTSCRRMQRSYYPQKPAERINE